MKNASTKARGSPSRVKKIREVRKLGYEVGGINTNLVIDGYDRNILFWS